jgi:energy-converting hydrogenase Eha subunit A
MKKLSKFVTDLFTGTDGVTWAIGRVFSAPVLFTGLTIPLLALFKGQAISFSDLGVYFGGLGASILALVTGTHTTEPKPLDPPANGDPS